MSTKLRAKRPGPPLTPAPFRIPREEEQDRATLYAFYFLMITLALGLAYMLALPFVIG